MLLSSFDRIISPPHATDTSLYCNVKPFTTLDPMYFTYRWFPAVCKGAGGVLPQYLPLPRMGESENRPFLS